MLLPTIFFPYFIFPLFFSTEKKYKNTFFLNKQYNITLQQSLITSLKITLFLTIWLNVCNKCSESRSRKKNFSYHLKKNLLFLSKNKKVKKKVVKKNSFNASQTINSRGFFFVYFNASTVLNKKLRLIKKWKKLLLLFIFISTIKKLVNKFICTPPSFSHYIQNWLIKSKAKDQKKKNYFHYKSTHSFRMH